MVPMIKNDMRVAVTVTLAILMAINSKINFSKINQWSYAETSIAPLVVFK